MGRWLEGEARECKGDHSCPTLCLSPATTGVKGTPPLGRRASLSRDGRKALRPPPGRQARGAPGRGSRALLLPPAPAPSASSLALMAPSVLPATGRALPVLPEAERVAVAPQPTPTPASMCLSCENGPRRPGRAAWCLRAVWAAPSRFCSKHGRRGVCAPDTPPLSPKAGCTVEPQAASPTACPLWAGCPQEPLG